MNRWRDLKFVVLYHIDPLAFAKICFCAFQYVIHFKTVLCVPKKNFFSAALETRPLGQACGVGQTFCSLSTRNFLGCGVIEEGIERSISVDSPHSACHSFELPLFQLDAMSGAPRGLVTVS